MEANSFRIDPISGWDLRAENQTSSQKHWGQIYQVFLIPLKVHFSSFVSTDFSTNGYQTRPIISDYFNLKI